VLEKICSIYMKGFLEIFFSYFLAFKKREYIPVNIMVLKTNSPYVNFFSSSLWRNFANLANLFSSVTV